MLYYKVHIQYLLKGGEPVTPVIGNQALLARLDRDIRQGQLSHAYILDGPAGSGRHTIARHLAATIACVNRPGRAVASEMDEDQMGFFDNEPVLAAPAPQADLPLPCGECVHCQKVYEDKCPDIHVIRREGKASIGVDAVRFLRQDVLLPPGDLDTKIYIIEDAELLTPQAQNALLLTLEEPPSYVLFLLLVDGADNLLETIRSRAPVLRTTRIPDDIMRDYLRSRRCTLPEEDLGAVILQADGCIGQALNMADGRGAKAMLRLREQVSGFIEACAARQYDTLPGAVVRISAGKRDAAMEFLGMMDLAVRDLILLRHGDAVHLKYYTDREAADTLVGRFTTRSLLRLHEAICHTQESLSANANVRLALMHLVTTCGR